MKTEPEETPDPDPMLVADWASAEDGFLMHGPRESK